MKSTLWKLTALAGVMGAGFLVVYQAQQNLSQTESKDSGQGSPPEQSPEEKFTALAELATGADGGSKESLPAGNAEPGPPAQSEPTPTLAADQTDPSNVDPFADSPQPEVVRTPSEESNNDTGDSNPFSDLLQSFAETPDPAPREAIEDSESDVTPAGYASIADQSGAGLVVTASLDPFANGLAEAEDREAPTDNQVIPEFVDDTSATGPESASPESEPTLLDLPSQNELSPLTPVESTQSEPKLIPAPVDVTLEAETTDAVGLPSPTDLSSLADETMLPEDDMENAIAQVSGERAGPSGKSQNPFLVFPDNRPAARPQSTGPGLPSHQRQPRVEPNPFGSNATPKQTILPDGSVEMTVPQRDERASESFDPFGEPAPDRQPRHDRQPPLDRRVQPTAAEMLPLFEDEPEQEPTPPAINPGSFNNALPLDNVQPFNDAPPVGNAPPIGQASPPVRSNTFDGIGTVTADSPTGTQQAQVTIEKIAPPDAVLNKPLVYSIKVSNIGQSPAENVVVKDMTPKGSRLEGTKPQAELDENEQKLVWRLGKMGPGEERTIQVKIVPTEARQIGSVATVTFEAAVAARTNITAPDLKLTVQGPGEVRVGEKAAYRFTLTNVGSADASGVYIRNLIPKGFQHPRGDDLEYEVGNLPKGQSRDVNLTLLAVAAGQYDNRAILGAEGDISIEAKKSVSVLTSRLKVHRQGPENRFVGRTAQFTNTIINESSEPVQNITVQETVPDGVEFLQASDGGQFNTQTRTITWQIPGLNPGQKRHLQTEVQPVTPGEKTTSIKAFDARQDMTEATSQMLVAGFSSLTIDVAHAGTPVPVGEEVALRLTIRNRGTAAAKNVQAFVEIPPEMQFVDAKGPVRHRLVGTHTIEFHTLNTLDVNGEEQFDIVLSAAHQGRDARVRVKLTSAELDGPLNKEESVVIISDRE